MSNWLPRVDMGPRTSPAVLFALLMLSATLSGCFGNEDDEDLLVYQGNNVDADLLDL